MLTVHEARLRLDCRSAETARAVLGALELELQDGPPGSVVEAAHDGAILTVDIRAREATALRAAINSAARLADAATRSLAPPPGRNL